MIGMIGVIVCIVCACISAINENISGTIFLTGLMFLNYYIWKNNERGKK